MNLLVISDTHMPEKARQLPRRLIEELPTADMIIHAGDWKSLDIYEQLKTSAPVVGVYGNIDEEDIRGVFPYKQKVECEGYTIGIVHGHGEKKTTEKRALEAFEEEPVDLLIFGHSHIPVLRYFKKTLLFNPGSVTDKRRLPFYSFGKITLEKDCLHAEHIFFKK
ncbi:metallophosphoesterase family protein [Halobacillus sp. H74]|uniref:metallophosphoesterase family protein n=1 Tax=Halobacillus sp. H74 TaxID=3457436 RepID=UPI003FCE2504